MLPCLCLKVYSMMMNPHKPFVLIGAKGHGMVIAEIIEENGQMISVFVDADPQLNEQLGYPVVQRLDAVDTLHDKQVIISIGNNATRKKLALQHPDLVFGTAVHPSVQLSKRASVGEGTVVMAGVCINSKAQIGHHCILNTHCSIDHECVLEDYVHVSPGASLAGHVTVGEGTHIGTGASVLPNLTIGKWCTIGAGAVVIHDIPDYTTVVGVPGKVIKMNPHE